MICCTYHLCQGSNNPNSGPGEPLQWAPGSFDTALTPEAVPAFLPLSRAVWTLLIPDLESAVSPRNWIPSSRRWFLETIVSHVIAFCIKGRQINYMTIKCFWTETEETRLGTLKVSQIRHSLVVSGKDFTFQCRVCGLDPWPENMLWGQKPKRKTVEAIL